MIGFRLLVTAVSFRLSWSFRCSAMRWWYVVSFQHARRTCLPWRPSGFRASWATSACTPPSRLWTSFSPVTCLKRGFSCRSRPRRRRPPASWGGRTVPPRSGSLQASWPGRCGATRPRSLTSKRWRTTSACAAGWRRKRQWWRRPSWSVGRVWLGTVAGTVWLPTSQLHASGRVLDALFMKWTFTLWVFWWKSLEVCPSGIAPFSHF